MIASSRKLGIRQVLTGTLAMGWLLAVPATGTQLIRPVWWDSFGNVHQPPAVYAISAAGPEIYVAGATQAAPLKGQVFNGGGMDAFIRKYDATGKEVWTRQFGTDGNDFAQAVWNGGGAAYVAGWTTGVLPGQSVTLNPGDTAAFVRKYDADGNEVWTREFREAGIDRIHAIGGDISGVYVAGNSFVRKYDLDGNELWTSSFGGAAVVNGLTVTSGAVYVAGNAFGALPGQSSFAGIDAFVRKYDTFGNEVWTRQYGSAVQTEGTGVAADASGVYTTGTVYGFLPGQTSAGGGDAYVRKYDGDGNELWTQQFGTPGNDQAAGISVAALGVYFGGSSETAAGSLFPLVARFDLSGNRLWVTQTITNAKNQVVFAIFAQVIDGVRPKDGDVAIYVGGQNPQAWVAQLSER